MDITNNPRPDSSYINEPSRKIMNDTYVTDRTRNIDDNLQSVLKDQQTTVTLPNSKNHKPSLILKKNHVLQETTAPNDDAPQEQFKHKDWCLENVKKLDTDLPIEQTENSFDRENINDVKINVSNKM
jgi:hypothetical protein